jgi:hypothetical protein
MKAITVILSLCLCTGIMQAQKMDSRSFVKQYSGEEGFRVTMLNRTALKMIVLLAKISAPGEDISFLSAINNIQIIELSASRYERNIDPLEKAFAGFCEAGSYEQVLEKKEFDGTEQIFCRFEKKSITGLIIWSKRNGLVNMVFLNGRFAPKDMAKILSKENKNIIGLKMTGQRTG